MSVSPPTRQPQRETLFWPCRDCTKPGRPLALAPGLQLGVPLAVVSVVTTPQIRGDATASLPPEACHVPPEFTFDLGLILPAPKGGCHAATGREEPRWHLSQPAGGGRVPGKVRLVLQSLSRHPHSVPLLSKLKSPRPAQPSPQRTRVRMKLLLFGGNVVGFQRTLGLEGIWGEVLPGAGFCL